tara:strand:+ start:159 stop:401 length:243 start_codon:yes stop_codon:yes gene_type:complete
MKNRYIKYKNQMLDLSKEELLQVYDYFSNELYTYFENKLIPQLKKDSLDWEQDRVVNMAIKKQSEFLSYIDDIREVLENK